MVRVGLVLAASLCAVVFGVCMSGLYFEARRDSVRRSRTLKAIGRQRMLEAHGATPVRKGLGARVLDYAAHRSAQIKDDSSTDVAAKADSGRMDPVVRHAGMAGVIDARGMADARLRIALLLSGTGLVFGAVLSPLMALMFGIAGFFCGITAVSRALRQEATARAMAAEKDLAQMLEVLVLGLQGGLSFDGAFSLYQKYYHGVLSQACARAYGQYSHGLATRQEALKDMSDSFDSPLLSRVVESIVRSLRFGTSLSATLSSLACESRAVRKTRLEEQIAKAPVKMLVPVGTLILPAMLMLILGPVVLDLMDGF